ncbi:SIR2 family protein [Leifsonia aquatica]|uniref:SIR2 family protein n=1 Tax=Leifsonia aquatica TaxID=144185 RepID=UPI0028AC13F3|nr:SIR2 family protein [Leifsonia aquatica]
MPASNEDHLLTLAFSLTTNPSAYALLIGAGVSKGAGLPTAWDVLTDLTRQAAHLRGEDPADPVSWFEEQFSGTATYETVLEQLAPTTYERQALLRQYFEPDPEQGGIPVQPSTAHDAIAALVKTGAVRVIITLNFDRLIETAIRKVGVEPVSIASEADIRGMPALHTQRCCIIHLHGDYLNPQSMLNTFSELAQYGSDRARLLQRVLSDYGLIAAGWSSRYDPALREAISEFYPGRFTFAWMEPGDLSEEGAQLLAGKRGQLIRATADDAFGRLADAAESLRVRRARHPLTLATAVETAKRELAGQTVSIALHDTLGHEFRALHELEDIRNPSGTSTERYPDIVARIDEASTVICGLIAALAYWGDSETDWWWIEGLRRFAIRGEGSGSTRLLDRRLIAGASMFYSAGVAAVAAQRWDLVHQLFTLTRENESVGITESYSRVFGADWFFVDVPNGSQRPHSVVQPILDEVLVVPAEQRDQWWQQFEILRCAHPLVRDRSFITDYETYSHIQTLMTNQERERKGATERGDKDTVTTLEHVRTQLKKEADQAFEQMVKDVDARRLRVRTSMTGIGRRWVTPVAEQLATDITLGGNAHPIVRAGLAPDAGIAAAAIRALSAAFGDVGRQIAWSTLPGGSGVVPSRIWLDDPERGH